MLARGRLLACVAALGLSASAHAVDVLTQHDDNARSGLNASETRLAPANGRSNGIVWAIKPAFGSDGTLQAWDATTLKPSTSGSGTAVLISPAAAPAPRWQCR